MVNEGGETAERGAIAERHRHIVELARGAGKVQVEDLADRLGVTPQTIRKDLKVLAGKSILSRVHGGAIVTSGVDNLDYGTRRTVAAPEKAAIGAAAAALIPDGASMFINIGTTTEAVAAQLKGHSDLMIVSNNLNVIDILSDHPSAEVIVAGGQVRASDRAVVGALAMQFIQSFKVDYALIGASAIDPDGSLYDFSIDEVQVARTILDHARKVILVSDSSKIGRAAPVRIGHVSQINYLVMDAIADMSLRQVCMQHNVNLIEVGGK
ncbi:Glycerol-3-phosphate regulon repressor [Sphingomonas sp. S2M10]|uniref:DeoR/GlpR family DNA-binding transcription regulator n=1 Tax=Sphingomonas TaxID=13687 RepID=UPI0016980722|nr:DeoR/GlpR family DNA-binding transcription regulator [Sphingomonas paucimobilis]MDG5973331.1 DeoR/GlpR family DNA-binding transcription regulator [Sphingomonas paucimobilis]NLS26686.1 Glycerol-3-phosphate regulon repressor [Sphingomonas sp. S2M10]